MPDCPHCNVAIEHLPGFVSQTNLETRLKEQKTTHDTALGSVRAENTKLSAALDTANTKAGGYDALVTERDTLKTQITGMEQQATRGAAMQAAGVDPAMRGDFELVFNSLNAGRDEPLEWDAWMASTEEGGARERSLLKPHFGKPGEPVVTKPNILPDPAAGDPKTPPAPGGKPSPKDVIAFWASPEYKAMSPADQKAKTAELRASTLPSTNGVG